MSSRGYIIRKGNFYWNETEWMSRADNAQVFPNMARAWKARECLLAGQGAEIVDLETGHTTPEPKLEAATE